MGNDFIVNPSSQQGESQIKKGSVNPANLSETTAPREAEEDDVQDSDATGEPKLEHKHIGGKPVSPREAMGKPLRKA